MVLDPASFSLLRICWQITPWYVLFLEVYGLDGLMGLFHLTICDFRLYTVLHSLLPFPSPSANWDWLRGGLKENELSLKLSSSLSHSYKWGSHMASALSGKLNLPKFLNIQGVQNKLQRAGLSTNPCLSKVALLVKVACSMRAHTHRLQKLQCFQKSSCTVYHLSVKAGRIFIWVFVLHKENCRIL